MVSSEADVVWRRRQSSRPKRKRDYKKLKLKLNMDAKLKHLQL